MRLLWYFLTLLFGLIGVLAVLRTIEQLAVGQGLMPIQLLIAGVMFYVVVICLKKARASG
jgi:NhaP-type Na+/H+ and K+/H+ antiporter